VQRFENGGNENVMVNGENLFYTPQASLRARAGFLLAADAAPLFRVNGQSALDV
jgi:hypothetical protein